MAYYMGNGGKVTKSGTPDVDINVTEWEMTKSSRLADITHSGSSGWAVSKGTVKEASGRVKAVWDDSAMPDATLLLDIGAEVTLKLKLGASSKIFTVPVVIETLAHQVNNQTGVVTYDFTWKSTGAVTGPA